MSGLQLVTSPLLTDPSRSAPLERAKGAANLSDATRYVPEGYHVLAVAREGDGVIILKAVRQRDGLHVLLHTVRNARPTDVEHERIAHELAVLTRLQGAPVATALAMEHARGRPWLILEDTGGESLNVIAPRFRAPGQALAIGACIAGAIAEVHRRGVVHRDLKPAHVLVLGDGSVRITDFGNASFIRVDRSDKSSHGSLAYMSPEQTGRMNRPVDKRADFYSFGVMLYELLTGRQPFEGNDPLEWIHAHIARTPVPPSKLDARIPASADAIVLKLLSKHAEDRYHGAEGLKRDLERAAAALTRGETHAFELGTDDAPDDFRVAHRLYGREVEVARLLDGFDRARSSGSSVVTLIGGYSGVGKSSLVGELYRPIVRARGRFVSGKFDQYKRDIPYATISQAFRELLRGLLSLGEPALAEWRGRICDALGVNARLIVDVIPELELIVGAQPPVLGLDALEGQNRFELVFSAFVRVFAQRQHPLILFLDDMQWADGATLGLLKILSRPGQFPDLQLILAFRNNEVDASHPFQLAIDAMRAGGASLDSVTVLDLDPEHVLQLVSDTVARPASDAASLAAMLGSKAGGNPFFIGELLQMLHARGLLAFDVELRGWTWDDAALRTIDVTDNVVELLIDRICTLPRRTRRVLTLASCFGSRFDVGALATVSDEPIEAIEAALRPALADGFIVAVDGAVRVKRALRFQHDRIQQAAYSLAADERDATHLRIGRMLRDRFTGGEDELLFDAVKHLDQGAPLLVDVAERRQLVELNLLAGRRAKAAIAWEPARVYLAFAASLFDAQAWTTSYGTTFAVLRELAECELLAGQFAPAEARFDELRNLARTRAERGDVANSQMKLYVVMGRYDDALRLGLAELVPLGEPLIASDEDLPLAIADERQRLSTNLLGLDFRSIVDRPVITDAEPRALVALLTSLAPAVYSRRPSLFPLLAMRIVNLSLEYGNCEHSCYGYSIYAMTLAGDGDAERALSLSEASIALNERFRDAKLRATVLHIHANHIMFWRRSFAETSSLQEQVYLAAMEVGDLTIAAYVSFMGAWQCLARGLTLGVTDLALERFENFAAGSHHEAAQLAVLLQRQFGRALRGLTRSPVALSDEQFDADEARARIESAGFDTGLVMHDLLRAMLAWYHGDFSLAESWLVRGRASLPAAFCLPLETTWTLFDALTAAALWDDAPVEVRPVLSERVARAEARLRGWARECPENFAAEHALAAAELARLQGRGTDALYGYELAVDVARTGGHLPLETVAAQLAVRHVRSSGLVRATRAWLRDATGVISEWGASALLGTLQTAAPEVLAAESPRMTDAVPASGQQLDMLTAIKASQALSRETAVGGLTQALLRVVLEHAGAQRSVVLLVQHGQLMPAGAASVDGDESHELPESVVRYVERSGAAVILPDAYSDPTFGGDAYIVRTRARSVSCLPILVQARVVGLLYLENNLVRGAFSTQRLALLEIVSTQLAISLENARLYEERQERAEQTARQEATAATAMLERRNLVALFEQAPAAIAMLEGPDHVFTLANSHYERMTGHRPLKGLTVRQAFPELAGQGSFERMDRVFATGEAFQAREALVKLSCGPNGALEDCYFDFVHQPLRDADQAVKGIMVLGFEVGDRVRALRALQDGEERLRLAIEASGIGNWEMDLHTGAIAGSVRFGEIFGYPDSPASWSYPQFLEHVLPSERAAVDGSFNAAVGAANTWVVECGINRADGTSACIEVRAQLRRGGDDRPRRMFGTVVDVTPRKTADAERQALTKRESAARREAEAASRSKDEFLAMLGHELRNPLAPIVTALHLIRLREGDGNHKERAIIERHVTHLVRLVDDLLDVSRITSGKIELKCQPIELAEVVAKAIELASPLIEQRRHELVVSVPYQGLLVDGDGTRLAQVVSNLLTNAAKYTEPGGRVTIIAERVAANVVLRVRDTGIGIAPEMLPRVFELFVQEAQALSRSQGGLGLGLAIVRSLVVLHGGTVSAESAGLGRGTEMRVQLPASDLPTSSAVMTSPPAAALALRPGARGSSVLIVDDNQDAADVLAEVLENVGYTVRVAYDGPGALRLVAAFTPDIALLDIGLPVMDGYELARLLKHNPVFERTQLIALSGYGQESDRQRSEAAGFDAHLVKPVDMIVLQTLMKRWSSH